MTSDKLKDLHLFTGSENWYPHPLNASITFTDGAFYVADNAGAFWLLDKIALMQLKHTLQGETFQVWKLEVKDSRGVITVEDGNGRQLHREDIAFTDFPEPGITLWLADKVILLPTEY